MNHVYLEHHDPDKNLHRFYQMFVTPGLFDEWSLGGCPRRRPKNCQSYPQVQNLYNDNQIRLRNDQIVKFSASGRLKRPPAA